jgi:Tfp pilus assembly protein PilW
VNPNPNARREAQNHRRAVAGMTLAEILVALTVFVVAAAVAMILYNALTQSYKRGDNATASQQNTRVGFESLVTDLRMTGFNYNPDGAVRPDEQLEGVWETAVTIRGDFDFEDATAKDTPELTLATGSSPYNVVSTGNDEIVTYALAKQDGTGGSTLSFRADVLPSVRDGNLDDVSITNLALVQSAPPYTLYRITGRDGLASTTRTPVADNIYALRFRYYDSAGAQVGPSTPSDPSDDIGGGDTSAAVAARASIKRIEILLTGMTPDPDLNYIDPSDTIAATRQHRKFTLTQDVAPRNLGYVGRPDIDTLPPSAPTTVVACPGHCDAILVKWDPAPEADLASQWTVLRGTTSTGLGSPKMASTNLAYVDGLVNGTGYYFRVRAEDSSGNGSALSALAAPAPAVVADATTPRAPATFTASGGGSPLQDQVQLTWAQVTTNVESVTCDPQPTTIRDLHGYRIFRSTTSGFTPNAGTTYIEPDIAPAGTGGYQDRQVVACRHYFYDIKAVDKCGHESAAQLVQPEGFATTQYVPAKPALLQATPSSATVNALSWSRVATNTNGDSILVDTYRIYRNAFPTGLTPTAVAALDWSSATTFDVTVTNVNLPSHVDSTAYGLSPGMSYYYRVSGLSACPDPLDEGALSDPASATTCSLGGTLSVYPYGGSSVTGQVTVSSYVSGGSDTFSGFTVITNTLGAVVATHGSSSTLVPMPYSFTWDTAALPPGNYTITTTAQNSGGCSESQSQTVAVTPATTCCIAPLSPVLGPVTGKISARNSDVLFSLVNNCAQDLQVTGQNISWTNITGNNTRLDAICYDFPASTRPEDCTPVLTFTPSKASPAAITHVPALSFGATRNSLNPLIVGYKFSTALISGTLGETITVGMVYRTTGATSDSTCTFLIQTNPLSVDTVEP